MLFSRANNQTITTNELFACFPSNKFSAPRYKASHTSTAYWNGNVVVWSICGVCMRACKWWQSTEAWLVKRSTSTERKTGITDKTGLRLGETQPNKALLHIVDWKDVSPNKVKCYYSEEILSSSQQNGNGGRRFPFSRICFSARSWATSVGLESRRPNRLRG